MKIYHEFFFSLGQSAMDVPDRRGNPVVERISVAWERENETRRSPPQIHCVARGEHAIIQSHHSVNRRFPRMCSIHVARA